MVSLFPQLAHLAPASSQVVYFFRMLHCGDIIPGDTNVSHWMKFILVLCVCVLVSESWRGQKGVPTNQPSLFPPSQQEVAPSSCPHQNGNICSLFWNYGTLNRTHTSTHAVNLRCEKKMLCCVLWREGFALNSVAKVARDFPAFLYLQSQITNLQ